MEAHEQLKPAFDLWNLIDGVIVINLDTRPDRWERLLSESAGIIPTGKLHRVPAVPGKSIPGYGEKPWFRGKARDSTWAGRGGCALAHRRALIYARDSDWERVLILEDDITFDQVFPQLTAALGKSLAENDWNVCYLGYTDPSPPYQKICGIGTSHSLVRVFGCNCAHAYLLDSGAREWILANLADQSNIWKWLSRNRAVDRWYLRTLGQRFRVLAVSPSLVNQIAGFSDIVSRETDYFGNKSHITSLGTNLPETHSPTAYWLKRIRNSIDASWDRIRGLAKSLRGF